jgi:hypothetical protein
MKPELHPDAAKNFNDKARALQDMVGPMTEALPSEMPTHIARPGAPAHVVSDGGLFDFKITGLEDQLGRTTARYFEHQGRRFGLEGDRYKELARLSEGVQRTNALRNVVSTKWVEDRILDWMKEQHTGGGTPALADFIAERCEEDVKEHEVWFPVARLSLESDLAFGNVVFKTIPKQMLDWLEEDIQGPRKAAAKRTPPRWTPTCAGCATNCRASPRLRSQWRQSQSELRRSGVGRASVRSSYCGSSMLPPRPCPR